MSPYSAIYLASTGPDLIKFQHLRQQRQRHLGHISYLVSCKKRRIVPPFIRVSCKLRPTPRIRSSLQRVQRILLRTVIKDTRSALANIEFRLYQLHLTTSKKYHPIFWNKIDMCSATAASTLAVQQSSTHRKKLSKLTDCTVLTKDDIPALLPSHSKLLSNPKVINLSGIDISPIECKTLELGLNFAQSTKVNNLVVTTNIERSFKFSRISPERKDFLRQHISDVLLDNSRTHPNNLSLLEKGAIKSLKDNPNLVITHADKGGTIVILNSDQYKSGVSTLLQDGSYTLLKRNPINTILSNVKKVVKTSSFLSAAQKKAVIPSYCQPGRLYALPKIHKPLLPFRPIVSSIGTPTYLLSKFLANQLKFLLESNPYTLKNSNQIIEPILSADAHNVTLVSFDVVSLFTSVPINGAISSLKLRLTDLNTNPTEIDAIISLTEVCVRSTVFTYDQQLYSQSHGLPMGGCLSPVLCDTYLYHIENRIMTNTQYPVSLWRRYVDDCLCAWGGRSDDIPKFLDFLNGLDPAIQFTAELEQNSQLPFLDILITRLKDKFQTSVYRKPFSVQLPPHARSTHILSHKITAFYSFVKRAITFCSTPLALENELCFLRCIARDRGFDEGIIEKAVKKFSRPSLIDTTLIPDTSAPLPLLTLPFYPEISLRIASILRPNFRVIFRPLSKLCESFHVPKDKTPDESRWGVYFIPCASCPKGYIGQTRRELKKRVYEHQSCVKKFEISKSNIAAHVHSEDHSFNFKNAKIIKHTNYILDLDFIESFHILKFHKQLVNDFHMPPISNVWRSLIDVTPLPPLRDEK